MKKKLSSMMAHIHISIRSSEALIIILYQEKKKSSPVH